MSNHDLSRRGALGVLGAAAAACAPALETPAYEGALAFNHGVASGDPGHDRVIIWTRITPERAGPVPLLWIVARNRELSEIVQSGVVETDEARDYTIKVDVAGLRPGAPYFFGFRAGAQHSAIGKTRTLPRGRLDRASIAVASCASYTHGFFNAYDAIAKREALDLVVHLGDYIYEYGLTGYGGAEALALGRIPAPQIELTSLADYRQRHAQYKAEPELQAAHAAAPWIVVWDDHEVANDSWLGGAENHDAGEGAWEARKAAALQAYYEWMPIREPEAGRALEAINRSFAFGDLFTLIMLETRLLARTEPLDYASDLPLQLTRWNFANPQAPVALRPGEADVAGQRALPSLFEEVGGQLRPVYDWRRVGPILANPQNLPAGFHYRVDLEALDAALAAPERALLGQAQEHWLAGALDTADATIWQVLGNQVLLAPVAAPDLSATPPALAEALEALRPGVSKLLDLTRDPLPLSADTWDGYRAQRARVLALLRAANGNPIVITGDSHIAWANQIEDGEGAVAVELGATSITSPSEAQYFAAAGIDFMAGVRARNAHVAWADALQRGFLMLTLTRAEALAEFFAVSTIETRDYALTRAAAFTLAPGTRTLAPVTEARAG